MKLAWILFLLCALCDAQTKTKTSDSFAESALTAYDSLRSLGLNVHASETGFQLRQVEAEKNLARVEDAATNDNEKREFQTLQSWSDLIRRHRELLTHGQMESSPQVSDIWAAQFRCLDEAHALVKPASKPSDSKAAKDLEGRWADKSCAEAAKAAIASSR
jgi:hypothetical protein